MLLYSVVQIILIKILLMISFQMSVYCVRSATTEPPRNIPLYIAKLSIGYISLSNAADMGISHD